MMGISRKVTIIIPVYGDNEPVDKVVADIRSQMATIQNMEILIVWTPSKDKQSPPDLEEFGWDHPEIIVELKRGYGRAYKTGFLHATGDIIVTLDGDGTYPAFQISELVNILDKNNLDFLTTNRLGGYEIGAFTPINFLGNHLLSLATKVLFGVVFKDSQSGMWIFKRNILPSLHLQENGMTFSTEIKIEAHKIGCKCAEIPIQYKRRREGQTTLHWIRDGFNILKFLLKKKFRYWFSNFKKAWKASKTN